MEAFLAKGAALRALNRNEEALACYDKACAIDHDLVAALVNRGLTLRDLGRRTEALASYDAALSLVPDDRQIWNHRGVALSELGRHEDALKSYDRATGVNPNDADVHFNRGNALYALNRLQEALASFDRALALSPTYVEALSNRGSVLFKLRRIEEALASYDAALAVTPDHAEAIIGRGTVLFDRGRVAEALACFDQVLVLRPDHVMALNNRSLALMKLGRRAQAIATQEQALAVEPNNGHAYSSLLFAHLAACDWAKLDDLALDLDARLNAGGAVLEPFAVLEYSADPRQQLRSAQNYARARFQSTPHVVRRAVPRSQGPIRLAYLSGDFRPHPVAHAIAELIERHDRSRFEVIGISYGPDDGSDIRARIKRAFNQFHDVSATSDGDAAELMSGLGVDIAVDLAGYTENARPGILAHRRRPCR